MSKMPVKVDTPTRLVRALPVILNPLTYNHIDTFSMKLWKRSLTVPDMVMSLADILKRYSRGQAVPNLPGVYADIDLSPYDALDKFQIIDLQRKLAARTRALNNELVKQKASQSKKEAETKYKSDVAAAAADFLKTQQNDNKTQNS